VNEKSLQCMSEVDPASSRFSLVVRLCKLQTDRPATEEAWWLYVLSR